MTDVTHNLVLLLGCVALWALAAGAKSAGLIANYLSIKGALNTLIGAYLGAFPLHHPVRTRYLQGSNA